MEIISPKMLKLGVCPGVSVCPSNPRAPSLTLVKLSVNGCRNPVSSIRGSDSATQVGELFLYSRLFRAIPEGYVGGVFEDFQRGFKVETFTI